MSSAFAAVHPLPSEAANEISAAALIIFFFIEYCSFPFG